MKAPSWPWLLRAPRSVALADVMKREYKAIVDAGFVLQLDCPDLAMSYSLYPGIDIAGYRNVITTNVEALNHATRNIPPGAMRMLTFSSARALP